MRSIYRMNFEKNYSALLDSLGSSERKYHLRLSKDIKIGYMKVNKYRFKEIFNSLPITSNLRVLDIGTTFFTYLIKKFYPNWEVSTIDLTDNMADVCFDSDIQFKQCNLSTDTIPFENDYFDIILFTEVLEHICAPPSQILKEVNRVLRRNGKMIISVPNIATLYNRVRLLLGISPLQSPEEQLNGESTQGYGHLHEYTLKEIKYTLETAGLYISRYKFIYNPKPPESGLIKVARTIYNLPLKIFPSLRPVIHIECYPK